MTSKRRAAERNRLVEADLADRVICTRCGATLATYALPEDGGKCTAALDDLCPGFYAIEDALRRANKIMATRAA